MYEESLFKRKAFENNYTAILNVKHEVNTYSMKKVDHLMKTKGVIRKMVLILMRMVILISTLLCKMIILTFIYYHFTYNSKYE